MKQNIPTLLCTTILLTALSLSTRAQGPGGPPPGIQTTVQAGFASQVDAELDNGSSFTSTDAYIELGAERVMNRNLILGVSLGVGQKSYDFSNNTQLSEGDPWEDIQRLEFGISMTWIQGRWVSFASPSVNAYYEDDADINDALTAGIVAGSIYRFNDRLSLGLGFGFAGQVEDDAEFFAFPMINWQITDPLRLENAGGFAATLGPGVGLYYDMTEKWTAGLLARNSLFRFRLDEDGTTPEGVGEESHTAVYAHIDYAFSDAAQISLFAGYQFNGELRLEDASGTKLADEDYDNPALLGIYTRFSF